MVTQTDGGARPAANSQNRSTITATITPEAYAMMATATAAPVRWRLTGSSQSFQRTLVLVWTITLLVPWITKAISMQVLELDDSDSSPSSFLQDVVQAAAAKERWDAEAVRVSQTTAGTAKVGRSRRYEFHFRAAESVWAFGLTDEVPSWKKLKGGGEVGPEILERKGMGRKPGLKNFELEGPLELRMSGGEGQLSLQLPMNVTHVGLKQIFVGEGIKVKLRGAQEVSLIIPKDLSIAATESFSIWKDYRKQLWPRDSCPSRLSVYIQGSASVAAYKARDPRTYIQTIHPSLGVIELLPEKCFADFRLKHHPSFTILLLNSRLNMLDKLLRNLLGNRIKESGSPQLVKAKISSSFLVRFSLELERDVDYEDSSLRKLAKWKTRPSIQKVTYDIVARVERGKRLRPVVLKKIRKPSVKSETTAWSKLTSNLSYTKFPSLVVAPEPLTLDVKW